jgi:hypothetical protein
VDVFEVGRPQVDVRRVELVRLGRQVVEQRQGGSPVRREPVGLHGGEDDSDAESGREHAEAKGEGDPETSNGAGIEEWLNTTEESFETSPFQKQYVPVERQLPPADLASIDAIVIHLHPEVQVLIVDSGIEPEAELDDRAAARLFDEEAAAHASRFQLDVLRAIDLLGIRPEIKSVVERAFPERCAAAVVPDIEAALQLSIENASLIYVTYDGEQVAGGRLIEGPFDYNPHLAELALPHQLPIAIYSYVQQDQ